MTRRAVFLDRDGVLVEDVDLLVDPGDLRLFEGVPAALSSLRAAGFRLVVVTNQPVVARGLATEERVDAVHARLSELLAARGASLDAFYWCPHHPDADVEAYRVACDCRKPRAGLLRTAARDLGLDLAASFMVGDRPSDVAAGRAAGCRTILVETGRHDAPPIVSPGPVDRTPPDAVAKDLASAARWILEARP